MKTYNFLLVILLVLVLLPTTPAMGQQSNDYPVYIVKEGDTLTNIAQRFGISPQELISFNNLSNPNILPIGTQLYIPSLGGISGTLETTTIPFGLNIKHLGLTHSISTSQIARINRLTSPIEVYAGAPLILPETQGDNLPARISTLSQGQTLLEISILHKENPWELKAQNGSASESAVLSGDVLYSRRQTTSMVSPFSPLIQDISITPLPLTQGETAAIHVLADEDLTLTGRIGVYDIHFAEENPGEYIALQGLNRNAQTGLVSVEIFGGFASGESFAVEQPVLITKGYFRTSPPLTVDPATIDPANTQPEEDLVRSFTTVFNPQRYWTEGFTPANQEPDCITAWYGDERVYNNTFTSFHTGVDYGVCVTPSLDIYAPAPGKVVFSGELTVRGNATIIDHGWGVYSGIWHQKETFVQTGDSVQQGQLIGLIGDTGRVSGPHLHWELWVGGQQVNPLTWLENVYP